MNIFILDTNPAKAASYHCDKHVTKMVLESAQIMSTVMHKKGLSHLAPYKPTHENRAPILWTERSRSNFEWLFTLYNYLNKEYTARYGKIHKCSKHTLTFRYANSFMSFEVEELTPFVQVMPEKYRIENDPVQAYRNYYMREKRGFAKWKNTRPPEWWR